MRTPPNDPPPAAQPLQPCQSLSGVPQVSPAPAGITVGLSFQRMHGPGGRNLNLCCCLLLHTMQNDANSPTNKCSLSTQPKPKHPQVLYQPVVIAQKTHKKKSNQKELSLKPHVPTAGQ